MSVPRVKVPLRLDRERTLILSFNALCRAEEATGMNLLAGEVVFSSMRVMRALVWAGLLHDDPTLTLEEAGNLIETGGEDGVVGAEYVLGKIIKAYGAAMPDPKPDTGEDSEEDPP